jgi:hypothetical protein
MLYTLANFFIINPLLPFYDNIICGLGDETQDLIQ